MAVRAAQKRFEAFQGKQRTRRASLFTHRGECSAQQARRPPVRSMRVESHCPSFQKAFAPAALRHEYFVFGSDEILLDQIVPIFQAHGVVLANSEALLLMGANHIADHVSEEPPVIEPPLPGLHCVVVGTTVQAQREKTFRVRAAQEAPASAAPRARVPAGPWRPKQEVRA